MVNTVKLESWDVHITGPFSNKKTGKSHVVVVYGEFGQVYMLKAQFIKIYLDTLLREREKVMMSNVDINHCTIYYEIGICLEEYGEENAWNRLLDIRYLTIHVDAGAMA